MKRCGWCCDGGILQKYHDEEWGVPLHEDQKQFEFLSMEVMQCGLNWTMMLKKREIFRQCFQNFDYNAVAAFGDTEIEQILATEGMIRSRRKIEAIIGNAKAFLQIINEYGSFSEYLWSFSNHQIYVYRKHQEGHWDVKNELSDAISKDLKKRGMKYLGSITIFSHLQACGMINDHATDCYRYQELLSFGKVQYLS